MTPASPSQIGHYGTIALLSSSPMPEVITSFGIDTPTLSFGRDTTCGVRLYYPDVSLVHAKLAFINRKAFLEVLGRSGVDIDGCRVYPDVKGSGTMIAIGNECEITIREKIFQFWYPPKEHRKMNIGPEQTPIQAKHAPRLSMIHSAQVFSPRPLNDQMEILRVLQSPRKLSPPSLSPNIVDNSNQVFTLVETDNPRVIQEGHDLVIMEDVPVAAASSSTSSPYYSPPALLRSPSRRPPSTPVGSNANPRTPRPSLHKAVLMRSTHRALQQDEELEEEEEVLGALAGASSPPSSEDDEMDADMDEKVLEPGSESESEFEEDGEEASSGSDGETNEDENKEGGADVNEEDRQGSKTLWRKSLEQISDWTWRGRSRSTSPEKDAYAFSQDADADEETSEHEFEQKMTNVNSQHSDTPANSPTTPRRASRGPFAISVLDTEDADMEVDQDRDTPSRTGELRHTNKIKTTPMTPQPQVSRTTAMNSGYSSRYSLAGELVPQRIKREEQPWRVRDLVVNPHTPGLLPPSRSLPEALGGDGTNTQVGVGRGARGRESLIPITDQERKAIQARRRSAVIQPLTQALFGVGGIPGMTPMKSRPSMISGSPEKSHGYHPLLPFSSPAKQSPPSPAKYLSPVKRSPTAIDQIPEEEENRGSEVGNETDGQARGQQEVDTRSLMERMKETVEGLKRRRESVLLVLSPSKPGPAPMSVEEEKDSVSFHLAPRSTNDSLERVQPPPMHTTRETRTWKRLLQEETPSLADDDASPDSGGLNLMDHGAESDKEGQEAAKKGRVLREGGRTQAEVGSEIKSTPKYKSRVPARKGRKGPSAEPEIQEGEEESEADEIAKLPPVRRGRKAASPEPTPAPAPQRRGRTPKVVVAPTSLPTTETNSAPKRRGRTPKPASADARRTQREAEDEADEEDGPDPLDSINDVVEVVETKANVKTRSTRTKIKLEELGDVATAGTTKTNRGKRSPASTTRSRKAPTVLVEKKNKPGSVEEEQEAEPVKVRVSKGRRKAAPVKEEEREVVTEPELPVKANQRVTRARTRS